MTKEEAIKEIEAQSKAGVVAFQVLSVDDTDAQEYLPDNLYDEMYAKMTDDEKKKYLSALIDDMKEVLEQHPDWGFKKLLQDTVRCRQEDGEEL